MFHTRNFNLLKSTSQNSLKVVVTSRCKVLWATVYPLGNGCKPHDAFSLRDNFVFRAYIRHHFRWVLCLQIKLPLYWEFLFNSPEYVGQIIRILICLFLDKINILLEILFKNLDCLIWTLIRDVGENFIFITNCISCLWNSDRDHYKNLPLEVTFFRSIVEALEFWL